MVKIELNKLRVFKRLNTLEAKVAAIEAAMEPKASAIAENKNRASDGADRNGEKAPSPEEILMMWRYTPEEIAEMNASGGSGA